MNIKRFASFILSLAFLLISSSPALAVIQNLNGLTVQTQSLQSGIGNISINSSGGTHTFNWNGFLPISMGGTGAGSFLAGSLIFSDGTKLTQDNANLFWDNVNKRLILGSEESGQGFITTPNGVDAPPGSSSGGTEGIDLLIVGGQGGRYSDEGDFNSGGDLEFRSGNNGYISLIGGDAIGFNNNGGYIQLFAGNGVDPQNQGGQIEIQGGDDSQNIGGSISLSAGSGLTTNGDIELHTNNDGDIFLNPGPAGSVKIEGDANSIIYVGSSVKPGCIALGDSDDDGITYITANDGVLSASSTKPSICQ